MYLGVPVPPTPHNSTKPPDIRRRLARYSQETCAELARNSQEEGFAGGLPARNARMFRHGPAPAVGILLSRGMAVDNIVDNYGIYPHARKRA